MYEWAKLCGGVSGENLGTWCMSEDKREAMKLLLCDEKYYNNCASDFEVLSEWERVLPLCTGMGSVALYEKQLSFLGINERSCQNICDFWREGNQKLTGNKSSYFTKKYNELLENQGIDVFDAMLNITKQKKDKHQSFLACVEELCGSLPDLTEKGAVLRFDATALSYARPDRYHAELFWERTLCGEKLKFEEQFILKIQTLIEVLLFLKEQKIPVTLHLRTSDSSLREQTVAYLQSYRLMVGELRFCISLDEPIRDVLLLCARSDAELRILPELLLRPSDFGACLETSLSALIASFPIGGLRYGGLATDSFSMALAARELFYQAVDRLLWDHNICDEKRQEILNRIFNY